MYALGWTHHSHSVQLIHAAAMLQLLLGNIGRPGGGVNALRGHANIQGGTDCGVAYHNLPGYIPIPKADHQTLDAFLTAVDAEAAAARTSTNFWSNTDRFIVSQLKAYYGTPRRARTSSATACIRGCRRRRPAATRTGAGRTSSTACTAATWRASSASA